MTIEDPITRRDLMAGAAATAVLASARGAGATRAATTSRGSRSTKRAAASRRAICRPSSSRARISSASSASTARQRLHHGDAPSRRSRRRARSSASSRAGQRRGPLHGIPLALKDNIDTAGILTTAASAVYADRIPTEDAECVREAARRGRRVPRQAQHARVRVRRHVGRHALRARAQSVESRPPPRRLVGRLGGRRRGAACAPPRSAPTRPHRCAIRPRAAASWGSRRRTASRAFAASCRCRRFHDHVGPLARSVADCALVMTALAGFDPLDPVSIRAEREDYHAAIGRDVRALRIGIPRSPFFEQLDPEIDAARDARARSARRPHAARRATCDRGARHLRVARRRDLRVSRAAARRPGEARALPAAHAAARSWAARASRPSVYIEQRRRMTIARNTIGDVFADVDVLVAPTCMAMPRRSPTVLANPARRGLVDPQHAAVQRLRHPRDQRAVRLHARRVADRHADHRPAARRSARARAGARLRASDGLAPARAAARLSCRRPLEPSAARGS